MNTYDSKTNLAAANMQSYFVQCAKRLNDPLAADCLLRNGIGIATAQALGIGYDPQVASGPAGDTEPCLIIPIDSGHYITAPVSGDIMQQRRLRYSPGADRDVYHLSAVATSKEVFVCDCVPDAISVIQTGNPAISLTSPSSMQKVIQYVQDKNPDCCLILTFGGDERNQAQASLAAADVAYIAANIAGRYQSTHDRLLCDEAGLRREIYTAMQLAGPKPHNTLYYVTQQMVHDIEESSHSVKTGFSNLDEKCGGLHSGLYCVAACSSVGKTTFCMQMADQIAATGTDVLFFSLEQSVLEIVSKSISRLTALYNMETAVSSQSIRNGKIPHAVIKAQDDYTDMVGDRISIIQADFHCDVQYMQSYIHTYIRRNHCKPVVMIDYLQIVTIQDDTGKRYQSTKDMIDKVVTGLKQISRDEKITIIIISSVNRSSYTSPIGLDSLKESGGIEYSCDCVWGLQCACVSSDEFDQMSPSEKRKEIDKAKIEMPRKVELVCVKNRFGISYYTCQYDYWPAVDLFVPDDTPAVLSVPRKAGRRLQK